MLPQRLIDMMLEPTCIHCGADLDQSYADDCTASPSGYCEVLLTAEDFHWMICGHCRGEGELRGWEGTFTEEDRLEWSEEDYDSYFEMRRPCEDCGGSGKVREISGAALERPAVREWIDDWYDTEAIYAMERRSGA
jgi:hypothetical protein